MNLALITCHFNPCGYAAPVANYARFRAALGPYPLLTMHAAFHGEEIARDAFRIEATPRNLMWQKEALLNRALQKLPSDYDAVAWLDADLLFQRPDWYDATCRALEVNPVVQMFSRIEYLLPDGTVGKTAWGSVAAKDRTTWRAPGGAIAARRDVLQVGLYDRMLCGGGDTLFMHACHGKGYRIYNRFGDLFASHAHDWCSRLNAIVQRQVGYVEGVVQHLWHGTRENRRHHERHEILIRNGYDPEADVRVGENGLLEWSSDKPEMHAQVAEFFRGRREDEA